MFVLEEDRTEELFSDKKTNRRKRLDRTNSHATTNGASNEIPFNINRGMLEDTCSDTPPPSPFPPGLFVHRP